MNVGEEAGEELVEVLRSSVSIESKATDCEKESAAAESRHKNRRFVEEHHGQRIAAIGGDLEEI